MKSDAFLPLRDNPEFTKLCERVSALIVTEPRDVCEE